MGAIYSCTFLRQKMASVRTLKTRPPPRRAGSPTFGRKSRRSASSTWLIVRLPNGKGTSWALFRNISEWRYCHEDGLRRELRRSHEVVFGQEDDLPHTRSGWEASRMGLRHCGIRFEGRKSVGWARIGSGWCVVGVSYLFIYV